MSPKDDNADDNADDRRGQHWHLSKSVPISIIAIIAFKAVALVIWATTLNAEVNANHNTMIARTSDSVSYGTVSLEFKSRDQLIIQNSKAIEKIDKKLDRILEKLNDR
jgi:RNA processing factor Prp31